MKFLLGFLFVLLMVSAKATEGMIEWRVKHPVTGEVYLLGNKGSVQELFIAQNLMPDPFYGLNEKEFAWFENYKWEFFAEYTISQEDLINEYIELEFGSIDTYSEVYINDSLLGKTANAFIPHRFQVKDWLKPGVNYIRVVITPPVLFLGDMYKNADYHLPAPNDVHDTAVAPYTRKPQYQFGWDWSLRMNTIGFNDVAVLHMYDGNRIVNKSFQTISIDGDKATVLEELFLAVNTRDSILVESELFGKHLAVPDMGVIRIESVMDNARLWWPRGFGEQHLYVDKIVIKNIDNQYIDSVKLKFGIKSSELIMEQDEWGTSYYFKINGEPVFCKGADYIPQDIFPSRIKEESLRSYVRTMAESNFNMVRIWGGGYYQAEAFYDECDKLGIMVWQDLMFACAMYPGDESFLSNVREELVYQIPRIGGHASVMLFNGNNEVEVAWGNWGFQIKYGLFGGTAREIEKAYDDLFKVLAPEIVDDYATLPYIHTSPLSNWGKTELYNHGSQHYWGVWHGKDPIEDFGKKIGRFNAEYGFQSFPEFTTLNSFSEPSDWDINSAVMKQHQKSYVGNDMILKHAKRLYGNPKDFSEFVYFSQLTQSTAVSMAVAGHRVDAPRCGGTLYWQLNDCWPVSSWSSIDYYGNWKALQYTVREDYRDVAIVRTFQNLSESSYYIVSGLKDSVKVNVEFTVYDLKGKKMSDGKTAVSLNNMGHFKLDVQKEPVKKRWFSCRRKHTDNRVIEFRWTVNGVGFNRTFTELGEHRKAEEKNVQIKLISVNIEKKVATIELKNKEFVADLWLVSMKQGVRFTTNFESYLPGTHLMEFSFEERPEINDFKLFWR